MIKTKYSEGFETLWNTFDISLGSKGSKFRAYREYNRLEINQDDLKMLISVLLDQIEIKRKATDFVPPFQHVERWLRNRRFEDEPENNRQFDTRYASGSRVHESPSTRRARQAFEPLRGREQGDLAITTKHGTHIPQGRH